MARILIVDDAVFMRRMLADILKDAGHDIVGEAQTGEEGAKLYAAHKPDLVTLDLVMPGQGGLKTIQKIRDHDPKACIVVVSAVGQQEDVDAAIEAGAADFLVKPFVKETVIQTVDRLLAQTVER